VDLLIEIIPRLSKKYLNIHWIIGGDGNKADELKFLVKRFKLEDRVELLGRIPDGGVCQVLNRGHIFINASISEAFCIAALEAASAGLLVVTTNVGGTPEVLPNDLMMLSEPSADSLMANLEKAIAIVKDVSPAEIHQRVRKYYSWRMVAERTEKIYFKILDEPIKRSKFDREKYYMTGKGCHLSALMLVGSMLTWLVLLILNFISPPSSIEKPLPFPYKKYNLNKDKWGDHSFDLSKNKLPRE